MCMNKVLGTIAILAVAACSKATIDHHKLPSAKSFVITATSTFNYPWRIAFLPDGRMLVTEKPGNLYAVTQDGKKTLIEGVPTVHYDADQEGLLDVVSSPSFRSDHRIYITYSEPGLGGSGLALARATLVGDRLMAVQVIWRQRPFGKGGQDGGIVTFDPSGKFLFLAVGERQRFSPAQDPNQATGKVLRLTLDGKPAPGNPMSGKVGTDTVTVIDPPEDSVIAKTAPGRKVKLSGPNLTPSETWSTGHRNPYGLAFDAKGKLWEIEMGPKGGDELNIIRPGRNYGWPVVSNGDNYDGVPIPRHDTHPEFEKPVISWTPVIAPAGLVIYNGTMFPAWRGSAFTGGLASNALIRITFDSSGGASEADRWDMGHRIRDVEVGPDGALWVIEDEERGRLLKLTPHN